MMELHICNKQGSLIRSYVLGDHSEIIVGRDSSCDVQIRSPSVSREHCLIEQLGHDVYVRDLGSSGGTLVSGRRVETVRVEDGIQVQVGPAVLRFVDNDAD